MANHSVEVLDNQPPTPRASEELVWVSRFDIAARIYEFDTTDTLLLR